MSNNLWIEAKILADDELDIPCDICGMANCKRKSGSIERSEEGRVKEIVNWVLCENCYHNVGWQQWEVYSHEIIYHSPGMVSFPAGDFKLLYTNNFSGRKMPVF